MWKRTLLLASVLAGVVLVGVVEYCDPAFSRVAMAEIVAALQDPLALFAERSPGRRDARALHPLKSIKGPHERVLSTVRERPIPPAVDLPVFAAVPEPVASIPIIPPQYDTQPAGQITPPAAFFPGPPAFFPGPPPFFPGSPPLTPGFPPTGPGVPPVTVVPPSTPETPPIVPETPTPPVTIALPEPATWAMMILGLLAIGLRRRARK
jgi:hypothetical protein